MQLFDSKTFGTKRYFLSHHNGKCMQQVIGINTVGNISRMVTLYLKLQNPRVLNTFEMDDE